MTEWQPIKTAPKDGRPLLVYGADCSDPQIVLVSWQGFEGDLGDWYDWWDDNAPAIDATMTHWMPLPEPPG